MLGFTQGKDRVIVRLNNEGNCNHYTGKKLRKLGMEA